MRRRASARLKPLRFLRRVIWVCTIGGHDDNLFHARVDPGFEQEWNVIDDDGLGVLPSSLSRQSGLLPRDARVDDSLKAAQLGRVAKNDRGHRAAIERVIWVQDGLAERPDDGTPGRGAGLHDLTGEQIGINGIGAASLEHLGDCALAGRDSAGESHENHRREDTMGACPATVAD